MLGSLHGTDWLILFSCWPVNCAALLLGWEAWDKITEWWRS